jgi:hypothetical protein
MEGGKSSVDERSCRKDPSLFCDLGTDTFTLILIQQKLIVGYLIEEEGASNGSAEPAATPSTATASSASAGGETETVPPPAKAAEGCKAQPASSVFAMDPPPLPPQRIEASEAFDTGEEAEEAGAEEQGVGKGGGH